MQHSIKITGVTLVLLLLSCTQKDNAKDMSQTAINSPIQNDSCDSPDANINCYFVNMPESLTATMTISDNDKGSEKLIITGNIYKKDGKTPYPNAILYAYHTDSKGEYSKKGNEKGVQNGTAPITVGARQIKTETIVLKPFGLPPIPTVQIRSIFMRQLNYRTTTNRFT